MNLPGRQRNPILWAGLALGALAGVSFMLNFTAMPVVMDVPLASLVIATVAATALLVALHRERQRGVGAGRVRFGSGAAALLFVLIIVAWSARERFMSYRAGEVRFHNGEVALAGALYAPRSRGSYPGVVLVHGSGPESRKEYSFFAKLFARNNFVALAYDKRGVGQSSGKLYESHYRDYAKDALAAVDYLKRTDGGGRSWTSHPDRSGDR